MIGFACFGYFPFGDLNSCKRKYWDWFRYILKCGNCKILCKIVNRQARHSRPRFTYGRVYVWSWLNKYRLLEHIASQSKHTTTCSYPFYSLYFRKTTRPPRIYINENSSLLSMLFLLFVLSIHTKLKNTQYCLLFSDDYPCA